MPTTPPSPTGGPSSDENDPGKAWTDQLQQATPSSQYPSQPYPGQVNPDEIQPQEMPQATPQSTFPGDPNFPGVGRTGSIVVEGGPSDTDPA